MREKIAKMGESIYFMYTCIVTHEISRRKNDFFFFNFHLILFHLLIIDTVLSIILRYRMKHKLLKRIPHLEEEN